MDVAAVDLVDPQIGSVDPGLLGHLEGEFVHRGIAAEGHHVPDGVLVAVAGEEVDPKLALLLGEGHRQVHEGVKGNRNLEGGGAVREEGCILV